MDDIRGMSGIQSQRSEARIAALKQGIERMSRLLAAERAFIGLPGGTKGQNSPEEIGNGLTDLLTSGDPIPPAILKIYRPFYPHVWTAIDDRSDANWIIAGYQTGGFTSDEDDDTAHVSKLTIQTVVSPSHQPAWASLETTVQKEKLTNGGKIQFNLVCNSEAAGNPNSTPSEPVQLALRYVYKDQQIGTKDVFIGNIPVTNLPFENNLVAKDGLLDEVNPDDLKYVVALIYFPVSSSYLFNLYHFSIQKLPA